MRGLGEFQKAQMKHRDARMFALAGHLKAAIEIWEQIAAEPFQPKQAEPDPPPVASQPPPAPDLKRDKLAYTVKEAAGALSISQRTLHKAIQSGALVATKLGRRTLLRSDDLRQWINAMPKIAPRKQP